MPMRSCLNCDNLTSDFCGRAYDKIVVIHRSIFVCESYTCLTTLEISTCLTNEDKFECLKY